MTATTATMTRTAEPNFALRRLCAALLVGVAILVAVVALNGLLASFGGVPASAAEAPPAASATTPTAHVARSGDTLWSIASEYRGDVDHDRYVDALIRLNGGTTILAGQAVRLP